MNQRLECDIVRDLLPTYADGLTSETTNRSVMEHLESCADCSQALRQMQEPKQHNNYQTPEVDYLKKVRTRSVSKSVIIGIVLMLLGISLIGFRTFYVGNAAAASDVMFDITVNGGEVLMVARLASSGLGISRVSFSDSNGMVNVTVYTAPKAFFNHGDYSTSYTAACDVTRIRFDEIILWENGKETDRMAARLYAAINPFVGDMPSNSEIADILGVRERFGDFTNKLQTDAEPYGWTIKLETAIAGDAEKVARDIMSADSYVMLATVGNLGYVTWEYTTELGAKEYTVTSDDATAFAGKDIKNFGESVSALQSLTERLGVR